MGISNVISLLSGIALFLFGMALMGDGLKQVAGNKLELILYRLTGNPIKGFLLGAGVTAVIQSSSATSVMIVGFVNSGMMKVRQAISIVLGAILGTSITGWIICLSDIGSTGGWLDLFSTATLTGVISVIGIVLRMAAKDPAKKHIVVELGELGSKVSQTVPPCRLFYHRHFLLKFSYESLICLARARSSVSPQASRLPSKHFVNALVRMQNLIFLWCSLFVDEASGGRSSMFIRGSSNR